MKPGTPPLQSTRVLDQLRERIRYMHYSLSTEQVYVYWVRFFIRWSARSGQMQHPRDMGAPDVEAFLSMLATERKVSASTHNQALSAVLFLYREVLGIALPWLDNINRPTQKRRIPSVLTKDEVAGLLAHMDGQTALLARLLYGTGMRLMEGMRLRIKDVDFDRHVIIVREAKGGKDRVVMMPHSLAPALRLQLLASRAQWEADRQAQRGGVETPHAVVWSGGITCTKIGYSGRSRRPSYGQAFTSPFPSTLCVTPLPPTYCRLVPTSEPCKSCWATAMCPPP
jgi:site-specific recombinase XerD